MKKLLTIAIILAATQTHAQSNPGEPVWPVVTGIECKPGQVRFEGRCLTPLPPICKPGQVVFEGRCLTPDRRQPAKRWCGEDVAPPAVRDLLRVFCR
jgi:hypothetical protein